MKEERAKTTKLLNAVLHNELSPEEALEVWPLMSKTSDPVVGNAYHQLYHYMSDKDIRDREPEYESAQRLILEDCINELSKDEESHDSAPHA